MALAVFVVGALTLTGFIAWATHRSAKMLQQVEVDFNLLLLPIENLLRLGLVVACLALGWISGLPREQFGWVSYAPFADIAIGLAVGVVVQIPLNKLTNWAIGRFGSQIYSPVVIRSVLPRTRGEWAPVLPALFLLFGWMHGPQGPLGVVMTATISVLLAGLFLWRGSLLPPMVAHYVVNLLQLLVAYRHRDRLFGAYRKTN
jgi:hypothetical protein